MVWISLSLSQDKQAYYMMFTPITYYILPNNITHIMYTWIANNHIYSIVYIHKATLFISLITYSTCGIVIYMITWLAFFFINVYIIFIYLYTWLIFPLKEGSQVKAIRVQGDVTLLSLTVQFAIVSIIQKIKVKFRCKIKSKRSFQSDNSIK